MSAITGHTGEHGKRAKTSKSREEIDNQRLALVENFLAKQISKKRGKVDPARVQAAKALYDKLKPTLASVEQTNINESDLVAEDAILQALESLVARRPDLVDRLVLIRERQLEAERNTAASSQSTQ